MEDRARLMGLFGILDRYVGKRFAGVYGLCLVGFVLLFLVVDGVSKIDDFVEGAALLPEGESVWPLVLKFYLNRIPALTVLFAPYLTLFAAIACLMTFTRHNELAAMLSSGRGLHRILLPVYLAALLITGVLVVAEDVVVPSSLRRLEAVERRVKGHRTAKGKSVPHLRDGVNTVVASRWFPDDMRLTEVSCLEYSDPGRLLPTGEFHARELLFRRHGGRTAWFPVGGEIRPIEKDETGRLHAAIDLPPDAPVFFQFTPTEIDVLVEDDTRSLRSSKIRELRRLYPDKFDELSMQLYARHTRPLANFVLLLLGLPFVARPGQRSIAAGLGVAFGCCAAYMAVDLFFQEMGARGELHPLVASWFAPAFFVAIGLARLDKVVT